MNAQNILLTGATGYIGGTVLNTLLTTQDVTLKKSPISVLVRGAEQTSVFKAMGLNTIQFAGFDDAAALTKAASEHDVVINAASGFEPGCATSLIQGLAERKRTLGREVHFIHTSGTTSLADSPILQIYPDYHSHVFSDQDPKHVVSTLRKLNEAAPYAQRSTDLTVIALGEETGVQTRIVYLPMLHGIGTGEFRTLTNQVPRLMRQAVRNGYVWIAEDGNGVKKNIHIEDAAGIYEMVTCRVLKGLPVPFGAEGVIFAENGEHTWRDVGSAIATAGVELGVLQTDQVKSLSLCEATEVLGGHSRMVVELAFVSSVRTSGDVARALGWQPQRSPDVFWESFAHEWKAVLGKT